MNYIVLIFSFQLYYTEKCFFIGLTLKKKERRNEKEHFYGSDALKEKIVLLLQIMAGMFVIVVKRFIRDEVGGGVSCRLNNKKISRQDM